MPKNLPEDRVRVVTCRTNLGELVAMAHGAVDAGEDGVAAVTEAIQSHCYRQASQVEQFAPVTEPDALERPDPAHGRHEEARRHDPARGDVRQDAELPEPHGGQHGQCGRHHKHLLRVQGDVDEEEGLVDGDGDGGGREQLCQIVALEDEELDRHRVQLQVEQDRGDPAAPSPECGLADVRVTADGGGGIHAPPEEDGGVATSDGEREEEREAQPPALGGGIGRRQDANT